MSTEMNNAVSVDSIRGRSLPEKDGLIVGYAWLIEQYNLSCPLPEKTSFISRRHRRYTKESWDVYTPRHEPEDNITGHLIFALRYEGIHNHILTELFTIINPEIIARWVRSEPTGRYSRRIWYLYETLKDAALDIPDAITGNYVDLIDAKLQKTSKMSVPSRRHRVNNNFPTHLYVHSKHASLKNVKQGFLSNVSSEPKELLSMALKNYFNISDVDIDQVLHHLVQKYPIKGKS